MAIVAPALASDEREEARVLWTGLFHWACARESEVSVEALQEAPVPVQNPIGHFIAFAWKEGHSPRAIFNPFD